jgi:hypothetical protein
VFLFSSPIPARAAWRLSWAGVTCHWSLKVGVAQRLCRSHESYGKGLGIPSMDDRYLSGRSIERDSNKTVRSKISSRPGTMHETAWGKTVDGGDRYAVEWRSEWRRILLAPAQLAWGTAAWTPDAFW